MEILVFLIVLFALGVGTFTDIKKREVPDWLSFALIAVGFGVAVIKSISESNLSPLFSSIIGFAIAFAIALLMFYTGQWGGGDAKILMGIGATLGAGFSFSDFFLSFIFNMVLVGAAYGLFWGIVLGIINRKKLISEMKKIMLLKNIKRLRYFVAITSLVLSAIIFFLPLKGLRLSLLLLVLIGFSTFYLWIYVKAVEKVCMIKKVQPKELTEGDWIVEDIIVNKKFIAGKKDLGVSKEQIQKLISLSKIGKIKDITIKTGIPFVPSFLISYIVTFFLGNVFLFFIK